MSRSIRLFYFGGDHLKHIESGGWLGEYDIIITHKNGTTERQHIRNRLTNAGLNMMRDALNGEVSDLELKYLALGDSGTPIDNDDTTLGNERFRTGWISQVKPGTGQLQSTAMVLDNEAVFHIQEIGIFAGSDATETADSGILVSRILWERDKTELESIQFVRTDTIQRG